MSTNNFEEYLAWNCSRLNIENFAFRGNRNAVFKLKNCVVELIKLVRKNQNKRQNFLKCLKEQIKYEQSLDDSLEKNFSSLQSDDLAQAVTYQD